MYTEIEIINYLFNKWRTTKVRKLINKKAITIKNKIKMYVLIYWVSLWFNFTFKEKIIKNIWRNKMCTSCEVKKSLKIQLNATTEKQNVMYIKDDWTIMYAIVDDWKSKKKH